jgi:hypothetical protein
MSASANPVPGNASVLRTRFTETFGIKHPIIQGGMQWVGVLSSSQLSPTQAPWAS